MAFQAGSAASDQSTITGGVVSLALSQTSWSLSDTKRSYASGQCMVGLSGSAAGCATGVAGLSKAAGFLSASTSCCGDVAQANNFGVHPGVGVDVMSAGDF